MPKVPVATSLLILLSLLPGCGTVTDMVGDAAAEGASRVGKAAGKESAEELDPEAALRGAVESVRGESIEYGFTMRVLDLDLQVTSGTYYADAPRWGATTSFTKPTDSAEKRTMRVMSIDGTLFAHSDGWKVEKDCWVALEGDLLRSSGVVAMERDSPFPIGVLDQLRPSRWAKPTTSGLMNARVPLSLAITLLPPSMMDRIEISNRRAIKDLWAEVVLEIAEGRLSSITFTGSSLKAPLELHGLVSGSAAVFLSKVGFKITYPLGAESQAAERPDRVVTQKDLAAGEGCQPERSA